MLFSGLCAASVRLAAGRGGIFPVDPGSMPEHFSNTLHEEYPDSYRNFLFTQIWIYGNINNKVL